LNNFNAQYYSDYVSEVDYETCAWTSPFTLQSYILDSSISINNLMVWKASEKIIVDADMEGDTLNLDLVFDK